MKKNRFTGYQYLLPSLIGVAVFFVVPFLGSLYYTFTKGITNIQFVWFQNFIELLGNEAFLLAAKNTAIFVLFSVPLLLLLGLIISVKLGRIMPTCIRWILLSPMVIPAASAAMGWNTLFGNSGLVNQMVESFGGKAVDFFGGKYAMLIFVFIYIVKNLGYITVIFTSAIAALPKEYGEVFALDSKSDIKFIGKIVIFEIAPILFFTAILSIVNSFQIFREIYSIYGDSPPLSMYVLQYFMNNNFYKLNYQRLSTAAFLVILAISLLVAFYMAYKNKSARGKFYE